MDIKVSDYIDNDLVTCLEVNTPEEVIDSLVDLLHKCNKIDDREAFKKAVLCRENISSTGIGMGVAIPHAKHSSYKDFFIAVGIRKSPLEGIDWKSIDNMPVRLVFLIGGPENKQKKYLHLLSGITKIIKDEALRKNILSSKSSREVVELLKPF